MERAHGRQRILVGLWVVLAMLAPAHAVGGGTDAKAVAKFEGIENATSEDADDFHVVINVRVHKPGGVPVGREVSVDGGNYTEFSILNDEPEAGQSTLRLHGGTVKKTKKNTVSITLKGKKNELKVLKAFWTNGGGKITNGDVKALPSFEVPRDPLYTIINTSDEPMGIRDLRFLLNAPEIPLDGFGPDFLERFGSPLADFVLPAGGELAIDVPGVLDPEKFLYAHGVVFDEASGVEMVTFLHGHQAPPLTAPALFWPGLLFVAVLKALRCGTRSRSRQVATAGSPGGG